MTVKKTTHYCYLMTILLLTVSNSMIVYVTLCSGTVYCLLYVCNLVIFSLKSIKGNLLTYLLTSIRLAWSCRPLVVNVSNTRFFTTSRRQDSPMDCSSESLINCTEPGVKLYCSWSRTVTYMYLQTLDFSAELRTLRGVDHGELLPTTCYLDHVSSR